MTKKLKLITVLFCVTLYLPLTVLFVGCGSFSLKEPVEVTGFKLNTYVSIKSYTTGEHSTAKLKEILNNALSLCDTYEAMLSRTIITSTLSQLNNSSSMEVPYEVGQLIETGLNYSNISKGAFDITIGSVSPLWDFTAETPQIPSYESINNALSFVDYSTIKITALDNGNYIISKPEETKIDLGAIAKGFIADKIKVFLLDNNIHHAIINLGGNVLCVGSRDDNTSFHVGIRKPFDESELLFTLNINDLSVVSSGNYERYFYENGELYHHILNPKTGYPYQNELTNVTVISKDSLQGDCLSTTCFALGLEEGLKLIENTPNVEAIFYTSDGTLTYSSGCFQYLKEQ